MVRWPRFVAGAVGLVWYLYLGGAATINPLSTSWLAGDWMQHWTGFLFFKQEPWTFPLGALTTLPYPFGTSIGFTDSNPLVAFALKPFAAVLPHEFQYIGLWLFLCFGLQGCFGALLCSVVTKSPLQQAMGGSLFALSPVLFARVGHDTLCTQWLLLALLYLGLRSCEDEARARRLTLAAGAVVLLAATIHPYLAVMGLALGAACVIRLLNARLLSPSRAAVSFASMVAGLLLIFWIVGYFSEKGASTGGFGIYSADLLTFFNPQVTSRLIPPIPFRPGQWEGFGFPGVGGWMVIGAGLVFLLRKPTIDWQHRKVIVWAAVILAVYAFSSEITIAGHTVAKTRTFYRQFEPIPSLFRASGRFIWPLHYLALLFGIWGLAKLSPQRVLSAGTGVLTVALAIQALDAKMDTHAFSDKKMRQARVEEFELARGHYDHLALYLPQMRDRCNNESIDQDHVFRYLMLAYRLGFTYNSGSFARSSWDNVQQQCTEMTRQVEAGQLNGRTVYVVDSDSIEAFKEGSAVCNRFDGDWICVSGRNTDPFRTYVETGRQPPPR